MTDRHGSPSPVPPPDAEPVATPRCFMVRRAAADGTVTLTAAGEIDLQSCDGLAGAIRDEVGRDPTELVIDIAGVSFLDSTGAGVLVDGHLLAGRRRVRYRVRGARGIARRVLEILDVYRILTTR